MSAKSVHNSTCVQIRIMLVEMTDSPGIALVLLFFSCIAETGKPRILTQADSKDGYPTDHIHTSLLRMCFFPNQFEKIIQKKSFSICTMQNRLDSAEKIGKLEGEKLMSISAEMTERELISIFGTVLMRFAPDS